MLENFYNTYASCAYQGRHSSDKFGEIMGNKRGNRRKWHLALNKRGRPRSGFKSRRKKKHSQWLVLHLPTTAFSIVEHFQPAPDYGPPGPGQGPGQGQDPGHQAAAPIDPGLNPEALIIFNQRSQPKILRNSRHFYRTSSDRKKFQYDFFRKFSSFNATTSVKGTQL